MSGQYKAAWLCEALLVSRSGYYHWVQRRRQPDPRALENIRLRERIHHEFVRSHKTYGSPRLARVLGCPGQRNRIARFMRQEQIFARQRSKYRPNTTDSKHGGRIAPNRLQKLTVQGPDQVWVTDATCILTGQGWLYLVAVLDRKTKPGAVRVRANKQDVGAKSLGTFVAVHRNNIVRFALSSVSIIGSARPKMAKLSEKTFNPFVSSRNSRKLSGNEMPISSSSKFTSEASKGGNTVCSQASGPTCFARPIRVTPLFSIFSPRALAFLSSRKTSSK
jgi:hypothetical protein